MSEPGSGDPAEDHATSDFDPSEIAADLTADARSLDDAAAERIERLQAADREAEAQADGRSANAD